MENTQLKSEESMKQKITLEFMAESIEDLSTARIYLDALKYHGILVDIQNLLRQKIKYGQFKSKETLNQLEEIQQALNQAIVEEGLDI